MMRTFMLPTMNFMIKLLVKSNFTTTTIKRIGLFYLIIITLFFASCAKDPGRIGYVIQPDDSKLNVFYNDTTSIYAYSEIVDSIRSDKLSVSAFGSLNDPVFGGTTAGFYTQFILSIPGFDFGEGRILDSLVLQLTYQGSYGDTNTALVAHTYETLQSISSDSAYYSNLELPLNPTDYSNYEFVPRLSDSVVVGGDTLPPMLRLNLTNINTSLGEKLLNADTIHMENTATFREYFAGLFVQSQPVFEDGAIIYFGLTSSNSRLSLYYKNDEEDSLRYDYLVTTATATVNKYEHNFDLGSTEFINQVVNKDTALGQENFYVQGYSGVQSVIKFPFIREWAKLENVAINEAKLVLPGVSEPNFFDEPYKLSLLKIEDDGSTYPLIDQEEGDVYFDGEYDESANSYTFRITRHIQSLISDTTSPNNGLSLFLFGGSVHPERYIFKGNQFGSDTTGIRLEILYTDL